MHEVGVGRDRPAAELDRPGRRAAERLDRGHPAQALLDRAAEQRVGSATSAARWSGCSASASIPPDSRLRVVSLPATSRVRQNMSTWAWVSGGATDLGPDQHRDQVVLPGRAPLADVGVEEGEQLGRRDHDRLVVGPVGDLDDGVGPAPEVGAVPVGDAEQLGDDGDRDGRGDPRRPRRSRRRPPGRRAPRSTMARMSPSIDADGPGGEAPVQQLAVVGVDRRVEVQQRPGGVVRLRPSQRIVDERAAARAEAARAGGSRPGCRRRC